MGKEPKRVHALRDRVGKTYKRYDGGLIPTTFFVDGHGHSGQGRKPRGRRGRK